MELDRLPWQIVLGPRGKSRKAFVEVKEIAKSGEKAEIAFAEATEESGAQMSDLAMSPGRSQSLERTLALALPAGSSGSMGGASADFDHFPLSASSSRCRADQSRMSVMSGFRATLLVPCRRPAACSYRRVQAAILRMKANAPGGQRSARSTGYQRDSPYIEGITVLINANGPQDRRSRSRHPHPKDLATCPFLEDGGKLPSQPGFSAKGKNGGNVIMLGKFLQPPGRPSA